MNELRAAAAALSIAVQAGSKQILGILKAAQRSTTAEELSQVQRTLIIARADLAVAGAVARAAAQGATDKAKAAAEFVSAKVGQVGAAVAALPGQALSAVRDEVAAQIRSIEEAATRTLRVGGDVAGQLADDALTLIVINGILAIVGIIAAPPLIKLFLGIRGL